MAGNIFLGILFGLFNTVQLHLAKGMERYGIETFSREKTLKEKGKKPLIYLVGLILNNTLFIYQFLGNTFSTATIFSSVFGVGLVVLLLFSKYYIKENIKRIEYVGALLILIGTIVVGYTLFELELQYEEMGIDQSQINLDMFWMINLIFLIAFTVLIIFSAKTSTAVSLIFGLVSGGCGGIYLVFLHLNFAQGMTISSFLNLFFILSFVPSLGAFLLTQWGFAKKAKASKLVPAYNSLYILIPLFVEFIIIEGTIITPIQMVFTIVIIVGVILMNIFKEDVEIQNIESDIDISSDKEISKEK